MSTEQERPSLSQNADAFHSAVTDTAIAMGQRVISVHGPVWQASQNLARTVLTLSAAFLVATTTFMSELLPAEATGATEWVVIAVWLCLLLASIAAVAALWAGTGLASLAPSITSQADALHSAFTKAVSEGVEPSAAMHSIFLRAARNPGNAELWSQRFLLTSLCIFVAALALLGLAGGLVLVGT